MKWVLQAKMPKHWDKERKQIDDTIKREDKVGFVCGGEVAPRDKEGCEKAHAIGVPFDFLKPSATYQIMYIQFNPLKSSQ